MKTLLIFCCLMLSSAAAMASSVELTIDNQSKVAFEVQYKGRDTVIDPKRDITKTGIPANTKVVTSISRTSGDFPPVATFILNPRVEHIGITIANNQLKVTGNSCALCTPKAWAPPTPIVNNKTTVTIVLKE